MAKVVHVESARGAVTGGKGRTRFVAIDDGHSETKVAVFEDGQLHQQSFPSRTVRGLQQVGMHGEITVPAYETRDSTTSTIVEELMVMPRGWAVEAGSDNRTQHYPVSDRNRVLVHHALNLIAEPGDRFTIGTTLPYGDYYLPGGQRKNDALIGQKKANLSRPVRRLDPASGRPIDPGFVIEEQSVFPEGMSAFFDAMLDLNADGTVSANDRFSGRFQETPAFVIIDVGGKTTDIVSGTWSGDPDQTPAISPRGSESVPLGALMAADNLAASLMEKFRVRKVPDPEAALMRRTFSSFGDKRDISDLCHQAVRPVFEGIREAVHRHTDDGSDLAYAIVVGGGAELMMDYMRSMFHSNLVLVPDEPRFANARGILKLLHAFSN